MPNIIELYPEHAPLAERAAIAAAGMLDVAKNLIIDYPEMYAVAADELTKLKGVVKFWDGERKAITAPLDAEKAAVMDAVRPVTDAAAEAERLIKAQIVAWNAAQEKIRAEQQRIAEKAASDERARLEKEAAKAEKKGNVEQAQATRALAEVVIAPPPVTEVPKARGVNMVTDHSVTVENLGALLHFLADHPEYQYLVDVKLGELKKLASKQGAAFALPGCRVEQFQRVAARAA